MTEDEARGWIAGLFGPDAVARVEQFIDMVVAENQVQNLIAPGTIATIWARHAADSAQLIDLAPREWTHWLDIGTGGGFPGMIVALLCPERQVTMVEPRRRRADFLDRCIDALDLSCAHVHACKVEQVDAEADVISARAVASVQNLLQAARHCATRETTWLLPRGRSGADDAARLPAMFHVEQSVTDSASTIFVVKGSAA